MDSSRTTTGSVEAFTANWKLREESKRYHFKRGEPENQIQFAFQNHWRVFRWVLGDVQSGNVLEVGAGRGSMSAFFAEDGFSTSLLDTSHDVLKIAASNFSHDNLKADYVCGDALHLPYADETFDVILSIGLFEHFADIAQPLREQIRVLKPEGVFLGYIVPERLLSVQLLALPVNAFLSVLYGLYDFTRRGIRRKKSSPKQQLFRNTYSASQYLKILKGMNIAEAGSFGMFPVPLVSHSHRFPFSLMHHSLENNLVKLWKFLLSLNIWGVADPWTCPENWGLAYLVWAKRGAE